MRNVFKTDGFTLLEVMISISIIALVIVSLLRMQSGTISLASVNKFNQTAPVLANRLLARITVDIDGFTEQEGDFGEAYPGITWTCDISDASELEKIDYFNSDNINQLKKIDLQIVDTSGGKPFKITAWRLQHE